MPKRYWPDGLVHAGFNFNVLPLSPLIVWEVTPSVIMTSAFRSGPMATSPLPLQSIMSITLGLPSDVFVSPIAPGSTYESWMSHITMRKKVLLSSMQMTLRLYAQTYSCIEDANDDSTTIPSGVFRDEFHGLGLTFGEQACPKCFAGSTHCPISQLDGQAFSSKTTPCDNIG